MNLVHSVVKFNERIFNEKDVKINVSCSDKFNKTIINDENIIKQIVQNLLEVILKAVDTGEINIFLSNPDEEFISSKNLPQGEYTYISFASTSLLLSEIDLECMFDPYKIVSSANRKNVLRAMVLASVKNLVQSVNGIVWAESKILKNTSFNVLIPN